MLCEASVVAGYRWRAGEGRTDSVASTAAKTK
jgi:hypothetical protein